MFKTIARFSVKFRWFIVIAWIVAIPVVTATLPSINKVATSDNSKFLPATTSSLQASSLESNIRGKGGISSANIVAGRNAGALTSADNAAINKIIQAVSQVKGVTNVRDQGTSADGQARQIFVGLNAGGGNSDQTTNLIKTIRDKIHQNAPSDLRVNLTGQTAESVDTNTSNSKGLNNVQTYTIILIIVMLFVVFRALLAPLVTLLPAGLAVVIAQPVIAESTKIGVQVSFLTQILLIVLLLGAGTDYGLFLVFRTREELRNGLEPKEAVTRAVARVGESITFSALTVIAALLSLLLASFGLYKGIGPALAIGLGVMLLMGLTFLPALLSIMGRAVFWPSHITKQPLKIGLWGKVADGVIKRPIVMLLAGLALLVGLSFGIIGYRVTGFAAQQSAPSNSDSAKGQQLLSQHFPAANNNPQLLILQFNASAWNNLAVVQKAQTELANSGKFSALSGPLSANGHTITPEALQQLRSQDPTNPLIRSVSQFISSDGRTVQFYGILKNAPSGSTAAMTATPAVRELMQKVAHDTGASQGNFFSSDAIAYDISHAATADLKKIVPVVLFIIAVLLAIMLRSLVAPWYLIVTVGLSYFSALGFAMLAFVHIGGQDGLNFVLPFMMFIFSMALGEDYNILVMSRIREESNGKIPLSKAVSKAIGITGTTITSAGIILAGTFAVLGIVGGNGNTQIQQIGLGIAFGIFLDTFFVRTLLVPSIAVLVGRANWWPSRLYHQMDFTERQR